MLLIYYYIWLKISEKYHRLAKILYIVNPKNINNNPNIEYTTGALLNIDVKLNFWSFNSFFHFIFVPINNPAGAPTNINPNKPVNVIIVFNYFIPPAIKISGTTQRSFINI